MNDLSANSLVVAFNFPPFNDGSAVTMAKRIIEADVLVDVIAANLSSVRSRDESLYHLVRPWVNSVNYVNIPVIFASEKGMRDFVEAGLSVLSRSGRPDAYGRVFSRSMWAHSHFLAAEVKARGKAKQWTAEYSDPLLWQADSSPRHSGAIEDPTFMAHTLRAMSAREQSMLRENNSVLFWAQTVPYILADKLLFTNEQQFHLMLQDAPAFLRDRVLAKSEISPHPTPSSEHYETNLVNPAEVRRPSNANQVESSGGFGALRIGYFGTFYPNRGGGEFLEALSLLSAEERSKVRLDVYTTDGTHLLRAAKTLGLTGSINILEPLPYRDFLRATQIYDALLVNDIATTPFETPSPFLPSKYSDYAGSTTPILAITIPGSPLDARATRWKSHVGMIDSLVETLRDMLQSLNSQIR